MTLETKQPAVDALRPPLVRAIQLRKELGNIGNTTLRRWVREGNFPKPIKLGANCVAWRREEVDAWLESRPRYDDVEG
jgi:prophage regulatory protein